MKSNSSARKSLYSHLQFLFLFEKHSCSSIQLRQRKRFIEMELRVKQPKGSGRNAVEAIADFVSIAQLPPGHDPGAGYGVATAARQRWHLAIRYFGLFGGPVAAAND